MIPVPVRAAANLEQHTVFLEFAPESREWNGEYYMRGGICWPMPCLRPQGLVLEGCALMAGFKLASGVLTVFEEHPFSIIDNDVATDGRILHEGLAPWFNQIWTRYYADSYFIREATDRHRQYMLQVGRSDAVAPKPRFVEAHWKDDSDAMASIMARMQRDRLWLSAGGPLSTEGADLNVGKDMPSVRALMALCRGLEEMPYRRVQA